MALSAMFFMQRWGLFPLGEFYSDLIRRLHIGNSQSGSDLGRLYHELEALPFEFSGSNVYILDRQTEMIQALAALDRRGKGLFIGQSFDQNDVKPIQIDIIDLVSLEPPFKGHFTPEDIAIPVFRSLDVRADQVQMIDSVTLHLSFSFLTGQGASLETPSKGQVLTKQDGRKSRPGRQGKKPSPPTRGGVAS